MKDKTRIIVVVSVIAIFLLGIEISAKENLFAAKRSAILPGLGQMTEGEIYRGLAFMISEVWFLHMGFNSFSKSASYARETRNFEKNEMAYRDDYPYADSINAYYERWDNMHEKANEEKIKSVVFWSIAGCIWAGSIADAYFFVAHKEIGMNKENKKTKIVLEYKNSGTLLSLKRSF